MVKQIIRPIFILWKVYPSFKQWMNGDEPPKPFQTNSIKKLHSKFKEQKNFSIQSQKTARKWESCCSALNYINLLFGTNNNTPNKFVDNLF